jgi:prepilin-type N-terminal cleavage/methylation domain-containing protein
MNHDLPATGPFMSERAWKAFTLIELLVVVTIIVVLLALLAPALDKAIDAAVKARCAATQHSLTQVSLNYALDYRRTFMPGTRGHRTGDGVVPGGTNPAPAGTVDDYDEHIPYLASRYINLIAEYAGNNNKANIWFNSQGYPAGGLPPIVVDPTYPLNFGLTDAYGSWMGYNYLAGHRWMDRFINSTRPAGVPAWNSPMSLSRMGSGQIWVCHNTWHTGGRLINVGHTRPGGPAGGGDYFNWNNGAPGPTGYDSAGGNVARVDGSSTWRDLQDMHEYASGASKDRAYWEWPAMW